MLDTLREEYNRILRICEKAEKYLDDNTIPIEEREKRIPAFLKLLEQLNLLHEKIGQ